MRRIVFRGVLFLALLGVGGYVALQVFLNSSYATGMVTAKLQAKFGVPVSASGVEVGTSSCAIRDLTFCEFDSPNLPPFLTVGCAEANLSISDLIHGNTDPSVVTLSNAKLVIRHNRDGHLLTRFPQLAGPSGPMPEIRLCNSAVTVQREGEPDCTFQGIDLVARADAGRLIMTGSATDPNWGGEWQAAATVPLDGSSVAVSVTTKGVHITPEVLRRVPYVSPKIWTHFTADGDTPVKLQLALGRPGEKVRYRVDLNPTHTKIYVPSIDLNAEQATGQVVVEDNLVTLREIRGKVASGELYLKAAELDFRQPQTNMHFGVVANRLSLHGLPPSWKLPPRLGGLLSGQADLVVRVLAGKIVPTGNGEGRVDNAMLGPLPVPNYSLKIQADADGFRFEPRLTK